MIEEWTWASVERIKEAAEELKAMIRVKYPGAQFRLARTHDDHDAWNLWTYVDIADPDEVNDLTLEREREMLIEERIPLYVVPTRSRTAVAAPAPQSARKTG